MNQQEAEMLAEKILQDALENIRQLGFQAMVKDRPSPISHPMFTPIEPEKVVVISQERYERGNWDS